MMEKFAVDLDKVLDDFEFNEDCAEQVASVSSSACNIMPTTKTLSNDPQNCTGTDILAVNKRFEIVPSFERHKDFQEIRPDNCTSFDTTVTAENANCKSGLDNTDPTNKFHTHDNVDDTCKVTSKQSIINTGQISLSIYTDMSHKFLQKQPHENNTIKIHNTYDKKLNQPNIKPSVSNVFNSLNEYINAPTGNLDCVEAAFSRKDISEKQADVFKDEADIFMKSASATNSKFLSSIPMDSNETVIPEKCKNDSSCIIHEAASIGNDDAGESINMKNTFSGNPVVMEIRKQPDDTVSGYPLDVTGTERVFDIDANVSKMPDFHSGNENFDITIAHIESNTVKFTEENANIGIEKNNSQSVKNDHVKESVGGLSQTMTKTSISVNHLNNDICIISNVIQDKVEQNSLDVVKEISDSVTNSSIVLPQLIDQYSMKELQKPIGFNNIEALSEKELNTYLAEFEVEESLKNDVMLHKSISSSMLQNNLESSNEKHVALECDVEISEVTNQSSTFNGITVADLSRIPLEKLDEGIKKTDRHKKVEVIENNSQSDNLQKLYSIMEDTSMNNETENKKCETEVEISINYTDDKGNADALQVNTIQDSMNHMQTHVSFAGKNTSKMKDIQHITDQCNNLNVVQESVGDVKNPTVNEQESENILSVQCNHIHELRTSNTIEENSALFDDKTLHSNQDVCTDTTCKSVDPIVGLNSKENGEEPDKPARPHTLEIVSTVNTDEHHVPDSANTTPIIQELSDVEDPIDCQRLSLGALDSSLLESGIILGKQPPFWVPDSDAPSCMLCEVKFTVLKRRHHCRACGKVLCSKCCSMKHKLEYQGNMDSRVCVPCYQLLTKANNEQGGNDWSSGYNATTSNTSSPQGRQPNPNNPMEYCSTIPPLQQLAGGLPPPPPTVMVPVGVLKREGTARQRSEGSKSVMFSDGIRPGCDLTELDTSWDLKPPYRKTGSKRMTTTGLSTLDSTSKKQNLPPLDPNTNSYIPRDSKAMPPTVTIHKGQIIFHNVADDEALFYKTLKNECEAPIMFAINRNLYAYVKIINLNCCVNKTCWNITSKGLSCVGQDEVIFLVETLPDETQVPKDLFIFINQLYIEAIKGNTVTELSFSVYQDGNLLGSREHAGFLFIRQTLQCLQKIVLPPAPFLLGLLVHRWETPWAKVFPLRLVLRLGAEYRYYPCPLVSVRFRDALYFEIGHTVMKVLADFRNFGYTLPGVRGLTIHLRNRMTDVMFPRNRYDQVIKGLNNSNDHVLAYASNFSIVADSHLVCIQTNTGDESSYQTQAINIHNKPRTVTGASFIVINGALKSSMGLSAKSSIVEDGLMVEIMPEKMEALKAALKNMQDFSIGCGRQGALEPDETVNIKWTSNDLQFNLGVKSPIDGQLMDGIPSIRVHNGTDYRGTSRFIRWTEVFIIKE